MFDKFFVGIGNVAFIIYYSIINIKIPKFNLSKKKEVDFKRFNLEKFKIEDDNLINKLREYFIDYFLSKSVILILIVIGIISIVVLGIELAGIYCCLVVMTYIFMLFYPQIIQQRKYDDLNLELPYALRHMGIELKSGKGLHDTLATVANEDYGSFSNELTRVLEEVRYGQSTENSLLEMARRVNSDGLSRCVQQIVGTLRVGGNLAHSLEVIADDISFDMHVKLKDYSQRLNGFILIYTFVAILAPVILLIMLMAASTVLGDIISSSLIMMLYVGLFPMVVVVMGLFIKKLEPKI
ncbi:MAG: type II secretion system F family protein [Methanobrevibacter sp.]|nr:type II secretion system F family protein [Methanobrevibacter sp.]